MNQKNIFKKKIVITGGNGFIGSHLINKFLNKNFIVLNIDKLSKVSQKIKLKNNDYYFKKCDLLNENQLKLILNDFKPNAIINAAAESHVDRSLELPKYFYENNVSSTLNLLEFIRKSKDKIELIHISTDEVFGSLKINQRKFNINSKYEPRSPYSASKASSDHAVRAYGESFGLSYKITNCSNNYGPFQYPEKLIPVIIIKCIERKSIPIFGNGENIRDWIHATDHVDAIYEVYKKGKNNNTYLIGSNNEIKNIDITKKICRIFDKLYKKKNSEELIKFTKDRKGHDFRYSINNSKICKETDWKPIIKLEEGLENTIKFYFNNYKNLKKIFPYG
jgi:dTDP-glucose 4,6-dehydratase